MSGYTPGPWRSSEQTGTGNWDTRNQGAQAIGVCSDEWIVADVWGGFGEDEGLANARLIAAAPDLLETVMYAIDNPNFDSGQLDKMCREVIAKATQP